MFLCHYVQGSTSPLARSPEATKTGSGLVNILCSVVRGLVENFQIINTISLIFFELRTVLNKLFKVLMMMIIKNVEKLPLKCCLVSSFFSHSIVHLATCTQTPRLIINFVPRPLSLCIWKRLELPLNLQMFEARKDGAVSIELQTSTTKKGKFYRGGRRSVRKKQKIRN